MVHTVGCQVDPPGPGYTAASAANLSTVASQERVLRILSYVLLTIHKQGQARAGVSPATPTGPWDPIALSRYVEEARVLLDTTGGPNDIAKCIVVVLQAYFLLLKDERRQAVVITEDLSDFVADNPLVLRLPIVWSAVAAVQALLESAVRVIAVGRLRSAMEPLASRLSAGVEQSVIGQELLRVFKRKESERPRPPGESTIKIQTTRTADALLMRQK